MSKVHTQIPADFTPRFLEHLDGRTIAAKVLRQRLEEYQEDLGGEASLSYAQKSLAKRAIWLETYLETSEAMAATGETVDIGKQVQALNSYLGILRTLGLERRAKEVPDLQTYLKKRKQ
jgi:hypothetical protein